MADLQVSVEALEGLEKRMTVTIPAALIEAEIDTRLLSVGRKAKLKGFRPGKVPPKVIRQHYGAGVRQEVLNEMVQSSYTAALDQEKLRPAAMPTLEQSAPESGADFSFSATFEIFPEFQLDGLDKLEVERIETEIGDQDVDDMLQTLRAQRATWNPVERKVADGDKVTVDFEGKVKDQPIEGGVGQDVEIIIGQGQMLEEFEKNLLGLSVGDEKTFNLKFKKDYQAEELAGKKASFTVNVKGIAGQELPDLDEEFVKSFGVESGDMDVMLTDVRKNMEREAEAMIQADLKRQVMDHLLATNPIDIPSALIQSEAGNLQSEAKRNLGIKDEEVNDPRVPSLDTYLEAAERRVRLGLLVSAVIEENSLKVEQSRVRDKIDEMCAPYEKPEEFKQIYFQNPQLLAQVESGVLEEQVTEWLVAQAKLTVTPKAFSELRDS
ncbi:MAG: trigger factor [Gammaproteobacteria bacterium]|jgi:trigger factor|nr:trigger factor [Chromatiales bacterium]MCP4925465.1 trigger factor [Gammaproteobacteria bacterium]MDP7419364.1 trigger factor [Gammaproteobacteria bacterium]MDP7661628.1 trigger factor [Gammaproteobacteria bacterium]HJP38809.1 trigger factor [Gammaproteobacteria bacterium]